MHLTNYAKATTVRMSGYYSRRSSEGGENAIDRGQPRKSRSKGKRG